MFDKILAFDIINLIEDNQKQFWRGQNTLNQPVILHLPNSG